MTRMLDIDLCTVICGSNDYANWGNQQGDWPDEGYKPAFGKPGIDVGEDEGAIDSRSKKHSWSVWDE